MKKNTTLLNNFLITDVRDGAIKINNSSKFTRSLDNYLDKEYYKVFCLDSLVKTINLEHNKEDTDKIIKKLNKAETFESFKKILDDNNIKISRARLTNLEKNFDNKEKLISLVSKEFTTQLKQFTNMFKFALNKFKEDGVWSLHICHYFVKGKIQDGSLIKSPLILIPIEIKQSDNSFVISKKDDVTYNEKLNFMIEMNYGIQVNAIFERKLNEQGYLGFNDILDIYTNLFKNLHIDFEGDFKIEKYISDDVVTLQNTNNLTIDYSMCISLLDPSGGKAKKDILEIVERNENPFKTYSIMNNNDGVKNKTTENDFIVEINKPLNLYQKYAVVSALEDNTIIFGPPGTGKSEVIATIVANIINNNKCALVVSDKKAALDVLYERFSELNKISLCAYDMDDPTKFYEKINQFQTLLTKEISDFKMATWKQNYEVIKSNFYNMQEFSKLNIFGMSLKEVISILENSEQIYNEENKVILDEFDSICKTKQINLRESFDLYTRVKHFSFANTKTISYLLRCQLKSLEKDETQRFLDKYAKSKDKMFLLSNFIHNHKIQNKGLLNKLFKSKFEAVELDSKIIIDFLKEFVDLDIEFISTQSLLSINETNFKFEDLRTALIQKNILDYLVDNNFNLFIEDFNQYIEHKNSIAKTTGQVILNNYLKKFKNIYDSLSQVEREEIDDLFSKSKMKRKQNVNIFASKFFNKLKLIFPIWIISPNRGCVIIPNRKGIFDYGIYDEASQMFIERALPLIYRSKINIVSGDDKQLKPTSFFGSRYESNEIDLTQDDAESLLERAKLCMWPSFNLRNHYRCNNAELIKFSSENFYNNDLEYVTKNGSFANAIEVVNVNGIWKDEINEIEGEAVLDKLFENYNKYKKIMVITLNKKQLDFIEKKFIKRSVENREIINKYDNDLIVFKNLENCQGNEADLVILSFGYGYTPENKFSSMFGPISQNGGSNRLNVAITRAKTKMIVVKSFRANDIKISTDNKDTYLFYKYVGFLDAHKDNYIFDKIPLDKNKQTTLLEEQVIIYIKKVISSKTQQGFKVVDHIRIGSCNFDYAIFSDDGVNMLLGINFNKIMDLSSFNKTMENLYLQKFITDRGYDVININELEWHFKNDLVRKHIKNKIEETLKRYDLIQK